MKGVVNGYEIKTLSLCNGKRTIRVTFLIDGEPYTSTLRIYKGIDEKKFLEIKELLKDHMEHNRKVEEWSRTIPWTTTMCYYLESIIYDE